MIFVQNGICIQRDSSSFSWSCWTVSISVSNLLDSDPCLSGNELCDDWLCANNGVDGYLGGDDAGVLNIIVVVIFSKNASNCLSDNALCKVSSGRIFGCPPIPSRTKNYCFILIKI